MICRWMILGVLIGACAVQAASGKDDMRLDARLTERSLARYGSFVAWSNALHETRETFNRTRPEREKVFSHAQFGNFVEAMVSIRKACDERGLDLIIARVPSPAEKAFAGKHEGQAPDPYIYLMQKLLADQNIEMAESLGPGRKSLKARLKDRYPADGYARKVLVFGSRKDFPGLDADFMAYSGNGRFLAGDLIRTGGKLLLNRPAIVFAVPAEVLYQESAVLPDPAFLSMEESAYVSVDFWDAANWHKLGFEPVPEPEDPFFKILDDRSLQLAPLLPGADSGMAGTLRLPLPDPPGNFVKVVLTLEEPAQLEVRASCGRDNVLAGVITDSEGSRVELFLRPTWLSRLLTLKFSIQGKARLQEIRLFRAN